MSNPFDAFDSPAPAPRAPRTRSRIDPDAISRGAAELGIDPVDLATAISYETGGTFDPDKKGPTTKWGQHQGLIQFGEPQRAKYGVRPGMTMAEQMPAVVAFLRDAGVRPGMGMLDVYSAINAGGVGRYNASDAAAGGMPGTVADKVNFQMADHRAKASRIMGGGSGGGGGTGGYPAPAVAAGNPFDQFDSAPAPSAAAALGGANPFDAFDAPDFSNLQTASGSTEAAAGLPVLPSSAVMSGNGDIPLRAEDREVGAIYTDKRGEPRRWTGDGWLAGDSARETTVLEALGGTGIDVVQGLTRAPESLLDLIGWATGGESLLTPEGKAAFEDSRQTLEQFKPEAYRAEQAVPVVQRDEQGGIAGVNLPSGESVMGTIGQSAGLLPQMVYGGGGAKVLAEKILPNAPRLASVFGYGTANAGMVAPGIAEQARTEALKAGYTPEEAQAVANKALAMAVPLTAATGGIGEGLAGVQGAGAKSLVSALLRGAAIEAPTESIEEAGSSAIGDIALGKKVDQADALEAGIMAAFGGGIPGAAVAGTEYMGNRNRPAAMPADGINIAELVAAMQPTPPAVVAEGTASPRQGDAPAAPPTPAVAEAKQEVVQPTPAAEAPTLPAEKINTAPAETAGRPDMAAASAVKENSTPQTQPSPPATADTTPNAPNVADLPAQEGQNVGDLQRAPSTPAPPATTASERLDIRAIAEQNTERGELDATTAAAGVVSAVQERLDRGDRVTMYRDGKPVEITGIERGMMQDAAGQRWGTMALFTEKGDANRIEFSPAAPVASPQPDATPVVSSTPPVSGDNARRSDIPSAAPADTNSPNVEIPSGQTSLKNAVTDAERVAEGRDPIIRAARKGNRETVDEAVRAIRETPSIGRETAARLAEGGPVELKDEAVLLVHKVDLRKRRDAAAERAQSPNVSEEARAIARREYDDAVQQIDEVDQAASRIGTESGRLLQLRKRMIAEDYSMPALERKLRMVVNRDLKPGEQAEIKELSDKVATLQRKLDAVESQQASAQVAEMLARLMKQAPGKNATLAERRAAAMESKAALSAMSSVRTGQQSIAADTGKPGQARAALADRLGRGVVARLERAGVLEFDERSGGTWDGTKIGIGNVSPENALGVLLHEVTHANMLDVLGEQGYERALRDLDALEAAGDPLALKAKRRAAKSGETGQRLDDERIAYMVEEATNAAAPAPKVTEFVRSLFSAFRRWAATSAVFRALEKIGVDRPTLKPADFAAFARKGLDRMVADAKNPESAGLRGKVRELENQLRTDTMTGMKNRRAFDEDEALGWPTVAAIDMDGLGKLNEAVGHEAANKVLKALADTFMAAENDSIRVYRHTGGDELAVRFKNPADADRVMADLQRQLDGMNVEMDVAGADGVVRSFTYEGIGISYGTGATYEQADAVAGRQKIEREAAGLRQGKQDPRPSRRLREDSPRPGGRREGDPPAVGAQRSIPEGEDAAPAGADPVAFFHLARMGAFHYADGARTEAEWTKRMEGDLGSAADRYRSMLPDAFKASQAQADRVAKGPESVAEAVEAIGDQRRPRDVKRVVRAVVAEGMRGEDSIISATAQALDMDDADVRTLFVQSESQARTLTEAQAELKDLRKQLRDAQKPDPETRYQDTRARDFQRRIAELEERIAAGDFAKREKTEHELVERNKRLQFELEKTKERFHRYAIAAEFAMRTPLGKLWGETYAGINFARAIMTSLDLSAVFRQGGFIALGNPGRAAKGIVPMLRAFASEKADFEAMQDINNRPNAPLYKKFGLELTGIGGDALSRTEEAYASRWVEQWSKWAGGGLIRGSGRAYTAFLNRLRADSFDAMLAALARDGSNPTKEEGLAIANYINVATGRAGGIAKNPGEVLTATFFAPRLVASRFQLLAGQPLYGGSKRTRKLIAQEYVRFMIGVSVAVTLAAMMRDDDDETKVIEVDPRSANFGKVRFGKETFLDPLAGLAQVSVFLARMATGEARQTKNDKLVPLRNKWRITDVSEMLDDGYDLGKVRYGGADVPQEIMRFMRTKLAPVPGALFNALAAEDMIGQETELTDEMTGLITPMSVGSLVDVMEAQGMARGTAINLLGILGMSVQYRKSDAEKAAEDANGIPGALGFGTAEETE